MSILAKVLADVRGADYAAAEAALAAFIQKKFSLDLQAASLQIRRDSISLNSVNGFFEDKAGKKYFFKFHLEEGENETVKEYYRAELLAQVGYPVEQPLFISTEVGEQILIYPYLQHERLFDVCRRIEQGAEDGTAIIAAQIELDKLCAQKAIETLSIGMREDYVNEALLQLFYWRLVDTAAGEPDVPGGRHYRFYVDQEFKFPNGLTLSYAELAKLRWNINGVDYGMTLGEAFDRARTIMAPENVENYPACIAHGDAHNGNIWVKENNGKTSLSYFDPAFAGNKMPVLLAEVKPLFHNIFAHADWLYDAADADQMLAVKAEVRDDTLYVVHNWQLPELRAAFLQSKLSNFWIPVLRELKQRDLLPDDWQKQVRAALFCCPTLVMNLRAGAGMERNIHTPQTSLLGLSIAMTLAAQPMNGEDDISEFFDKISQNLQKDN